MVAGVAMSTGLTYAVVTPSRGLVHSRTIEAVLDNVWDVPGCLGWLLTHDLPIPDCDEQVAEAGLDTGADVLWFVEEDVIPPAGALRASLDLLADGYGIAAIDYPVSHASDAWGCIVRQDADIIWCGLGATLIPRATFEAVKRPWFVTDWEYRRWKGSWKAMRNHGRYGQQDIHFCMAVREAGLRIGQVPGMIAGHAQLVELGRNGTNVGYHTIAIRERIVEQYPGPKSARR